MPPSIVSQTAALGWLSIRGAHYGGNLSTRPLTCVGLLVPLSRVRAVPVDVAYGGYWFVTGRDCGTRPCSQTSLLSSAVSPPPLARVLSIDDCPEVTRGDCFVCGSSCLRLEFYREAPWDPPATLLDSIWITQRAGQTTEEMSCSAATISKMTPTVYQKALSHKPPLGWWSMSTRLDFLFRSRYVYYVYSESTLCRNEENGENCRRCEKRPSALASCPSNLGMGCECKHNSPPSTRRSGPDSHPPRHSCQRRSILVNSGQYRIY